MKNLKLLFVFALIFAAILSCEKDDKEETPPEVPPVTILKSTISAKWEVEGDSDYEILEFNESGTYVVVKTSPDKDTNEDIILFGTYYVEGDKLILSNFGVVWVQSLTDDMMTFRIKLDGVVDYGETLTANRSEELPSSSNTTLLCRTWHLITLNGDSVAGTDNELFFVFYKSGTYFVTWVYNDNLGGLAEWKWYDSNESAFCYSWDGEPDCSSYANTTVSETELIIDDNGSIYYCIPVNSDLVGKSYNKSAKSPNRIKSNVFNK